MSPCPGGQRQRRSGAAFVEFSGVQSGPGLDEQLPNSAGTLILIVSKEQLRPVSRLLLTERGSADHQDLHVLQRRGLGRLAHLAAVDVEQYQRVAGPGTDPGDQRPVRLEVRLP